MAVLHLKAKPNARQNALQVSEDGAVTVRLKAPAQDGKANACLLSYLADLLAVPKSRLALVTGHTVPFKKVEIEGFTDAELLTVLAQHRV
ncbi:DUF167 domain-containing protein [Hymenobacter sp. BT491]|uniref:DUF167 domain-containing protein n=1 Tax=Hymenobacter sp. BT491 TaxID=2766779 RepID=UPI001653985D|nr:DUF167 domain-containing protein [Hymenobacter sp. BT491]MBC6988215.1 DUF167 domain-containing protein [Hymenobacter sp. BT491]